MIFQRSLANHDIKKIFLICYVFFRYLEIKKLLSKEAVKEALGISQIQQLNH